MKKRVLATLMSVSLVAAMLVGCGNSDSTPASSSNDSSTSKTESSGDSSSASTDASSTDTASTGGDYKFEIIVKSYQSSYWQAAVTGVNQKAEELGVTVNCTGPNAESDIADQVNMLNNAINSAPNGIGLAACDQKACLDSLQTAMDYDYYKRYFDS